MISWKEMWNESKQEKKQQKQGMQWEELAEHYLQFIPQQIFPVLVE